MTSSRLALLAHGFNVRDRGVGTIGRLRFYFTSSGWPVINFDMGWMGLVRVRLSNCKHAERMANAARNAKRIDPQCKVVAVGHSNGCAIIHLATTEYNAPIDRVAYINPALNNDAVPGQHVQSCTVWYSPDDKPVKLAKWLPAHDWGDMGAVGCTADDSRITNINKQAMAVSSRSHSDFADEDKLAFFAPLILQDLIE